MAQSGTGTQRVTISYFEGVNSSVQHVIAKTTELSHVENARSKTIGALEKREGQAKYGTTANGYPFYAIANYGLTKFINTGVNLGIFRLSQAGVQDAATLTLSVFDLIAVGDYPLWGGSNPPMVIHAVDYITVSEPTIFPITDGAVLILDGTSSGADIYSINTASAWTKLSATAAQGIIGAPADFCRVDKNLAMVNGSDYNRLISADGVTVSSSASAGSMFNSPRAHKIAYYKSRIYLANITSNGITYPTTIKRSSYALGVVALVNGDYPADNGSGNWVIPVTDFHYFYSDAGMNQYEVYRGNTRIAVVTLDSVQQTTITASDAHVVFDPGSTGFLAADEIWVAGTFTGDKQYRWARGASSASADPKQYDTFKIAGGDEDGITMLEPIGNILMIANKNTMMTWNDYMLENMDLGIGCVSPRGYGKLMGSIYFIHYTGIYSTTGSPPTLISRKIERYIRGATKGGLENAAVGTKGLSVFFSIGAVTLYNKDGSTWKTLKDVCLEFNVADQTWFVHTNVPGSQFATFVDITGTERLLMSHTGAGASVKEFLVGNTDDGVYIQFRADTQTLQLMRTPESYANPVEIISEVDRGASMTCFVSLNDDDFYEIQGPFRKGTSTLKVTSRDTDHVEPPACRTIRVSYRDTSPQICKIVQSAITYIPTSESTPSND